MALKIIAFLLGGLIGIAVNYLADVLPAKRRLARPACQSCQTDFKVADYLLFRNCPACGLRRSSRGWIVEAILAFGAALIVDYSVPSLGIWISILLFAFLVLVMVIDIEHRLIMHVVSLAGAILSIGIGWKLHGWSSTLLGGAAGFGLMLALYFLGFAFIRISRKLRKQEITESEAIGFGDVNLSGIVGLLLGWPGVIGGLVLAIIVAGAVSLVYLLWMIVRRGYSPNMALPYGPFLALSAIILLYIRPLFMRPF